MRVLAGAVRTLVAVGLLGFTLIIGLGRLLGNSGDRISSDLYVLSLLCSMFEKFLPILSNFLNELKVVLDFVLEFQRIEAVC